LLLYFTLLYSACNTCGLIQHIQRSIDCLDCCLRLLSTHRHCYHCLPSLPALQLVQLTPEGAIRQAYEQNQPLPAGAVVPNSDDLIRRVAAAARKLLDDKVPQRLLHSLYTALLVGCTNQGWQVIDLHQSVLPAWPGRPARRQLWHIRCSSICKLMSLCKPASQVGSSQLLLIQEVATTISLRISCSAVDMQHSQLQAVLTPGKHWTGCIMFRLLRTSWHDSCGPLITAACCSAATGARPLHTPLGVTCRWLHQPACP
jgi:hypothetical protein